MTEAHGRRQFLRRALAAGSAVPLAAALGGPGASALARAVEDDAQRKPPNERLQLGVIGVGGRGHENLVSVAHEAVVALADIDLQRLTEAKRQLVDQKRAAPDLATYADFRKLLERRDLDAVVVSTPDHTHAVAVAAALRLGLDVYCEKPLAHSVHEVRVLRELAAANKRVTQMGTQIHAGDNYRRVVEVVRAGILGKVRRVHVWMGGRPHTDGVRADKGEPPAHVDYDLWLGPAPHRAFHTSHFHFKWRYWFDFGGGTLADFGCHYMDLPHWALGLRAVDKVEATGVKDYEGANDVPGKMRVEYRYPARGELPPVHLTWHHGGWMPEGADAYGKGSAVLFEGENGRLLADYDTHKLFLDKEAADAARRIEKERIPSSIGHHREWLAAVRTRGTTTATFDYSGALAETVLLGNVSYRAGGILLDWDDTALCARNTRAADGFVRREYRAGWSL